MDEQVTAEQLEAIHRESAALIAAYRTGRTVRLLLLLALIAFVAVLAVVIVNKANQLTSQKYLDALMDAGQKRLDKRQDDYLKQAEKLLNKVHEPLTKAFNDQVEKDMPVYIRVLEKERVPFLANLQTKFYERLDRQYQTVQPRLERILAQEFPKYSDKQQQDRMVRNINRAVERLFKKYYVADLEREINDLYETWDTFPLAPPPRNMTTEEQFTAALLALLQYRLNKSLPAGSH